MNVLKKIHKLTKKRHPKFNEVYLGRRIIKLGEEKGETCEAYLSVTSQNNTKNKSWDDVREEAIDTAIVGLDIALTRFPGEEEVTDEEIIMMVEGQLLAKLAKWKKQIKNNTDITK